MRDGKVDILVQKKMKVYLFPFVLFGPKPHRPTSAPQVVVQTYGMDAASVWSIAIGFLATM